jgi:magnesium-transporting ATPase (P-type)
MLIFLNSIICTVCLLIALVPEALFMSMTKSLGEFTRLSVFQERRLLFRNMGAIEKMG